VFVQSVRVEQWMARKQQTKSASKRKHSVTRIVFYVLSVVIVLSMTIGFVIDVVFAPSQSQSPTPVPLVLPTYGPSQP
jgi:hypothetical protein